ncbi:MAG: hypothetical protein E6Z68_16475 [Enterococcus casseliflavus]|nr:hypothetical protein [Enterococcus casseliflavus]
MVAAKENKVIYGLENAHYAKLTFGTNGVPEFSTPTALKGAVELALEPQSNSVEFAADNDSQYFSEEENQVFQFDGDATKTRHVLYYCNGSRAKVGSKTGKDISGVEVGFKAKQLELNGKKVVKSQTTSEESTKYADWFKSVYVKTATQTGK